MPDINISRNQIPLLLGGTGDLTVRASVSNPLMQLTPTDNDILSVTFGVGGGQDFSLGAGNTVKLGVKAGANANLTLWPTSSASRLAVLWITAGRLLYNARQRFDPDPELGGNRRGKPGRIIRLFVSHVEGHA